MNSPKHLLFLMNHFFWGFFISFAYGFITSAIVYYAGSTEAFHLYHKSFFIDFNCLISGGLIIGAALLVYKTQQIIPDTIESAFEHNNLEGTGYYKQKKIFFSLRNSMVFSTEFVVLGFIIFYFAKFPLEEISEYFMMTFGCIQYGLGVYVGRKLFYIAQMLNSIEKIEVRGDIFKEDKLSGIATYVNAISTITIIFVYVHVTSYYHAPFAFDSITMSSIKMALLLPAIIATPVVVLFNFYPRSVLRKIYSRSIELELDKLTGKLRNDTLTKYERLSYLIEVNKISRDELQYRLRLTLSDLPIGITIIIMLVGLLK